MLHSSATVESSHFEVPLLQLLPQMQNTPLVANDKSLTFTVKK